MCRGKDNSESHEVYIRKCIALAKAALKNDNTPVGSVLVFNNKIIGEGIEAAKTTNEITDHAEILAIRDAISKGHINNLKESTLYSTHEPCVMCSYGIRHHKIPLIVFGIPVAHIGGATSKFNILSAKDVPIWDSYPEIIEGILWEECHVVLKEN